MKPIKVGLIRCDTHSIYYAPLMAPHDPLTLQRPVDIDDDPPHSWMNGVTHFYLYGYCADPRVCTVETVDGFEITKVWDHQRFVAEAAAEVFVKRPHVCDSFDEVSDDVDLVFIGNCNEDGSNHLKLATPGLSKGVPTFVDKPMANEVKDVKAILDLSKKHNAPVFSASILRHLPGSAQFRRRLEEVGNVDCGTIRAFSGAIAAQIHAVSLAQAVFGNEIEEVHAMGPGDMGVVHLSWGDRDDRPKSGVVLQNRCAAHFHCAMHVAAYGPMGAILSQNNINDWHFPFGAANIIKLIKKMVLTGEVDESLNDMIEAVSVVNAARLSMQENSRSVRVEEVA